LELVWTETPTLTLPVALRLPLERWTEASHAEEGAVIVKEVAGEGMGSDPAGSRLVPSFRLGNARTGKCLSLIWKIILIICRDQCRFPHVIPDENTHISPISPRGGYPGPFGRMANGRRPTILGPIEDKMGDLSVKEVCVFLVSMALTNSKISQQNENIENPEAGPRSAGVSKQFSSSPKVRPSRAPLSTPSTPINRQNAHLQSHQQTPSQRLPSADDFPVLTGSATPPSGNGATYGGAWSGPTAAQVLKGIGAKKGTNASGTTPENGKVCRTFLSSSLSDRSLGG
jgi:hypothetical protein